MMYVQKKTNGSNEAAGQAGGPGGVFLKDNRNTIQKKADMPAMPETTPVSNVVQRTDKGKKIGKTVGTVAGVGLGILAIALAGPVGWLALLGGAVIGYKAGEKAGDWLTGRNQYSALPMEDQDLDILQTDILPAGTPLYHGTRYKEGDEMWWKTQLPKNVDKDDGGICFTRDPNSTPKVGNANIIIRYVLKQDVHVIRCRQKGEFRQLLSERQDMVVYAPAEQEVRFNLAYANQVLQYDNEYSGRPRGDMNV